MTLIGYLKFADAAEEARRLTELTGKLHHVNSNTPEGPFFVDRDRVPTPRTLNAEKGAPDEAVEPGGGLVMFVIWVNVREAPGLAIIRRTVVKPGGTVHLDEEFDAFDTPERARKFIQATYPDAVKVQGQGVERYVFEVWAPDYSLWPQSSPASS